MMRVDDLPSAIRFVDLAPAAIDYRGEVIDGLRQPRKALPPKFFYDERGCALFEAICALPEYYLTRAEIDILTRHGSEIATAVGEGVALIELGSGSSRKIRLLLERLRPSVYMALDIARDHLRASASALAAEHPWLSVEAVCVDFSQPFRLPPLPENVRRVAFFPGSSIGNFDPSAAAELLRHLAAAVGPGGGLLIGFDLRKDPGVLHRAYNDRDGLTAAFNLNVLARLNREFEGGFVLDRFRHDAFFSDRHGRIEMHLVSTVEQTVRVAGETFEFQAGESIHTENSYKYSLDGFAAIAATAGFTARRSWFDRDDLFCVQYLTVQHD